jgi:tRNA A-37 threonylcarbamoyl transferase component Bud32
MEQSAQSALKFGRYEVIRLLGQGAMGKVYLALDPVLKRQVAIKVMGVDSQLDHARHEEYLKRFALEAQASARLSHPSIVAVYDAGEEQGLPWIAFEYIDGERLEDLLRREGPLPIESALAIGRDIASALHHAHSHHIVHRDIKPGNMLFDKKTITWKLADFGVVKAPFSGLTQEGKVLGSPGYMSPEQIDGTEVDARSDLFSLGVVMYEMLAGVHPFTRDSIPSTLFATLNGTHTPLRELRHDVPAGLNKAVVRLLAVKSAERIQSAEAFLELLSESDEEQAGTANAPASAGAAPDFRKASRITVSALTVACRRYAPAARTGIAKLYAGLRRALAHLRSMTRRLSAMPPNRLRGIVVSCAVAIACAALILFLVLMHLSPQERRVMADLADDGYRGSPSRLLTMCRQFLRTRNHDEAEDVSEELVHVRRVADRAYVLLGWAQLCDEDYDDAADAFGKAETTGKGRAELRKIRRDIFESLHGALKDGEASRDLIALGAGLLHLDKGKSVNTWTEDKDFWLRWNSVHVLEAAHRKVDMLPVWALDLKYASSARTRSSAAEKLGELKDRRAVPALKEAAQRGFQDPLVSATANAMLEMYYR